VRRALSMMAVLFMTSLTGLAPLQGDAHTVAANMDKGHYPDAVPGAKM